MVVIADTRFRGGHSGHPRRAPDHHGHFPHHQSQGWPSGEARCYYFLESVRNPFWGFSMTK